VTLCLNSSSKPKLKPDVVEKKKIKISWCFSIIDKGKRVDLNK
jgi:hypothetical protein